MPTKKFVTNSKSEQIERAEHVRLVGHASLLAGLTTAEKIARVMSRESGLSNDDAFDALRRLGAVGDAQRYRQWP